MKSILIHVIVLWLVFFLVVTDAVNQTESRLLNNQPLTVDSIKERLVAYDKAYPRKCPSQWQDEYNKQHKEILSQTKPKLLVAIPNLSGMADRFIGYVTTCLIAFLTNRAFQVGNRSPLPIFEHVFTSPNINWTRTADAEWLIEPLKHKAKERNYNQTVLESKQYFAVNTLDDYRLQDKLLRQNLNELMGSDALTTLMVINRGKTIRMFENKNHFTKLNQTGLTAYTAFGCILTYLFQPKPNIFLHTPTQFMKLTNPDKHVLKIAVQIRAGDNYLADAKHNININDFKGYFQCANQIEKWVLDKPNNPYTSVIWYLVTDSVPLRHAALKEYGEKIVTSADNVVIEHSSKESSVCKEGCQVSNVGFETAAAEWWLMLYSRYFVISEYSGFGRSAGMTALQQDSIYTIPYKKAASGVNCDEKSFTDLETLSYHWSGI